MNLPFTIFLSPEAQQYFKQKLTAQQALQLELKPSGCSGFSYHLKIIEQSLNQASYLSIQGLPFLVRDADKERLNNTLIDFKKDGLNQRIIFDNPNTENHCGCGESFSFKRSI